MPRKYSDNAIWERIKLLEQKAVRGARTTVSVIVGGTTTTAAGTNARVENAGDDVNVDLRFFIPRGSKGDKGDKGDTGDTGDAAGFGTPTASVDGNVGTPSVDITASGSDTAKVFNFAFHNLKGIKGDKGDTGDAFHIVKTYASVAAMNADYSGTDVKIGEYVMITSSVEDPDNAKVYIKGSQAYEFVVDMSGATGIKGDKGDTGATGNGIATVTKTSTSGLVDTYTITYTDGTTSNFTVTNGAKGDAGDDGNGISNAVLNQDYTLTLTFTDGTTYTTPSIRGATGAKGDTGATGNGIASIAKTGTSGLVDTYTITFTNGTTATFTVTNGAKGDKGDTGDAAGFGTVSATVDANTGTPSVDVTTSGTDTAKNFAFTFHNLKGQKGDKGDTGSKGDKGDTFTYDDLTPAQKAEIKADLRAYYSKEETYYTTTGSEQGLIPTGIQGLRATDILFVDVNGLDLAENEEYTRSGTNIQLATPISSQGEIIHFLALRAVAITAQDYAALKGDPGEDGRVQDVLVDGSSVVNSSGIASINTDLTLSTHAGTSPTAAGTTTKVVTTKTGDFTLTTDAYVVVRFTNATTTSTSLNVDGRGSKTAYYNGSRISSSNGAWAAGDTVIFQYNGTRFNRIDYADTLPVDVRLAYQTMALGWDDVLS